MSLQKLKIGVIGVGHMGQYHLNVVSNLDHYHCVGIYDIDQEQSTKIAAKYQTKKFDSLPLLLQEIDAVVIAVSTYNHYEVAKQALEYDCHILIEKPLTNLYKHAEELINLALKKNKVLQVGHVERFNGAVMELSKIVTQPLYIEAKRLSPYTPRIKDVGVVLDMIIHDLDIVINLVQAPIDSYICFGKAIKTEHEDIATINLNFKNNTMATIIGSRLSQYKERSLNITQQHNYVYLNYANQDIEIHRQANLAYLMTKEEIKYSQEAFIEKLYIHKDNPLKSEHEHFYDCIVEKVEPIVSNIKDLETLSVALSSIEQIKKNHTTPVVQKMA